MTETEPFAPIETLRLQLRCVRAADAGVTAALMSAEIARWLASWESPLTYDKALVRIEGARAAAEARRAMPCALIERATGALMGWIAIGCAPKNPERAILGYWIGEAFQGRGFMREAAQAIIMPSLAFLGVDVIEADAQYGNAASLAIIRRLGMQPTGERDIFIRALDQSVPCLSYELRR